MLRTLRRLGRLISWISDTASTLLLGLLVVVVLYNVLLRYGFNEPPFWTDRVGTSANMTMVLIALSLAVRHRDLIAMQAIYELTSPLVAALFDALWNFVILALSVVFAWHGVIAAMEMPGMYWDFQAFCVDVDFGGDNDSLLLGILKLFEDLIGFILRPLCVDGAVPQRYMAMLMPISGVLLVIASIGVIVEDVQSISKMRRSAG